MYSFQNRLRNNVRGYSVSEIDDDTPVQLGQYGIFMHKKVSVRARQSIGEADITFVDGDHTFDGISVDLEFFAPITKFYLCGHDFAMTRFPGIPLAVTAMRSNNTNTYERYGYRMEGPVYLDSDFVWWNKVKPDTLPYEPGCRGPACYSKMLGKSGLNNLYLWLLLNEFILYRKFNLK